jgi:hypothetical protein
MAKSGPPGGRDVGRGFVGQGGGGTTGGGNSTEGSGDGADGGATADGGTTGGGGAIGGGDGNGGPTDSAYRNQILHILYLIP